MRIAYLECFSGISGDMFMGALVDAGVAPQTLEDAVAALHVGARLEISRVVRSGFQPLKWMCGLTGRKTCRGRSSGSDRGRILRNLVAPASRRLAAETAALRRTLMSMSMGGIRIPMLVRRGQSLPLRQAQGKL